MSHHVYPVAETDEHDLTGTDCRCEPDVWWLDPETGLPWGGDGGPLVIHSRLHPVVPGVLGDEL